MTDCTREDCGHPVIAHGDRAVAPCYGDPTKVPNEWSSLKAPACRCLGYSQIPGKPADQR